MREIGLHIRDYSSLIDLAQKGIRVGTRMIQCFFVKEYTSAIIPFDPDDVKKFLALREAYFDTLFLHGSYWINLASLQYNGYTAFKRELSYAKKLQFTHMVLHPGTAKGAQDREAGINALAKMINKIIKFEHEIRIVLENTAHARLAVGSDMHDFYELRKKLDRPEKISFCIDTAHAFVYGYNLASTYGQEQFIALLHEFIGIENIALIHLNDTKETLGSHIDRHAALGEGKIGYKNLREFVLHPQLQHIPLMLELPAISEEKEIALLDFVRSWK